jgi:hypothetical protein
VQPPDAFKIVYYVFELGKRKVFFFLVFPVSMFAHNAFTRAYRSNLYFNVTRKGRKPRELPDKPVKEKIKPGSSAFTSRHKELRVKETVSLLRPAFEKDIEEGKEIIVRALEYKFDKV